MTDACERILLDLTRRYPSLTGCMIGIGAAYEAISTCYASGGKLLLCGNGGSCADGEHIVGELMKGFVKRRPLTGELKAALSTMGEDGVMLSEKLQMGLPAVALNAPAISSAAINDLGGEMAYAQQLNALGKPGDVLLGISTSGNAMNIHYAALLARAKRMTVIGLTGGTGGIMARDSDIAIVVPETETYKIQELHLPVYHALCMMVEDTFFTQ